MASPIKNIFRFRYLCKKKRKPKPLQYDQPGLRFSHEPSGFPEIFDADFKFIVVFHMYEIPDVNPVPAAKIQKALRRVAGQLYRKTAPHISPDLSRQSYTRLRL